MHEVLEQRPRPRRARGCQCGHDNRNHRVALAQSCHESGWRLHLADRYRVNPDPRGLQLLPETEALTEAIPVTAIPDAAPQHQQADQRCYEVDREYVEKSHAMTARRSCSSCRHQRLITRCLSIAV